MKTPLKPEQELINLTGEVLRDLARNESASREWRKAAVKILIEKGFPYLAYPELRLFVAEIEAEREAEKEVEALVEGAVEAPVPENGHLKLSKEDTKVFVETILNPSEPNPALRKLLP